jgi:hypothetical protein
MPDGPRRDRLDPGIDDVVEQVERRSDDLKTIETRALATGPGVALRHAAHAAAA